MSSRNGRCAIVAVVAWWLMLPPHQWHHNVEKGGTVDFDAKASLAQWERVSGHRDKESCEKQLRMMITGAEIHTTHPVHNWDELALYQAGRCLPKEEVVAAKRSAPVAE